MVVARVVAIVARKTHSVAVSQIHSASNEPEQASAMVCGIVCSMTAETVRFVAVEVWAGH